MIGNLVNRLMRIDLVFKSLLVIGVFLLVFSFLILSAPGRRIPIYCFVIGIFCLAMLSENRSIRSVALVMALFTIGITVMDYNEGVEFQKKTKSMLERK